MEAFASAAHTFGSFEDDKDMPVDVSACAGVLTLLCSNFIQGISYGRILCCDGDDTAVFAVYRISVEIK